MPTLADDYPRQQKRVREILKRYQDLPHNAGAFGAHMIEHALTKAEEAAASGDITAMLVAYQTLVEIKD